MTTADARQAAAEMLERAQMMGASVEHPESTRLTRAANIILDLCAQIEALSHPDGDE